MEETSRTVTLLNPLPCERITYDARMYAISIPPGEFEMGRLVRPGVRKNVSLTDKVIEEFKTRTGDLIVLEDGEEMPMAPEAPEPTEPEPAPAPTPQPKLPEEEMMRRQTIDYLLEAGDMVEMAELRERAKIALGKQYPKGTPAREVIVDALQKAQITYRAGK